MKKKKRSKKKKKNKQKEDCKTIKTLIKKKKKNVFSMQVELFLRFEGLSLGLKYRQTKKGLGTIFRDRKTHI